MPEVYTSEVTVPDLFEVAEYGLTDAVSWLPGDAAGHWSGGIQYEANCYHVLPTISPCISGAPDPVNSKQISFSEINRGSRAFTLYARWDCSPADGVTWDTGRDKALRALASDAPFGLEQVFWSGTVANAPALNFPNLVTTTQVLDSTGRIILQPSVLAITGTLDVVEALNKLEETFAACYSGKGVVHVPLGLINSLCDHALVYERNGRLYTWKGNRVVIGAGYATGIGPNRTANAAGVTQMYMTSPVFGIRGAPRAWNPVEVFDRSINTLRFIAEQTFLLGWQCCLVSVNVSTGGSITGSAGAAT